MGINKSLAVNSAVFTLVLGVSQMAYAQVVTPTEFCDPAGLNGTVPANGDIDIVAPASGACNINCAVTVATGGDLDTEGCTSVSVTGPVMVFDNAGASFDTDDDVASD